MTITENSVCPICGTGILKPEIRDEIFTWRRRVLTVSRVKSLICTECKDGFFVHPDSYSMDKILTRFRKEVDLRIEIIQNYIKTLVSIAIKIKEVINRLCIDLGFVEIGGEFKNFEVEFNPVLEVEKDYIKSLGFVPAFTLRAEDRLGTVRWEKGVKDWKSGYIFVDDNFSEIFYKPIRVDSMINGQVFLSASIQNGKWLVGPNTVHSKFIFKPVKFSNGCTVRINNELEYEITSWEITPSMDETDNFKKLMTELKPSMDKIRNRIINHYFKIHWVFEWHTKETFKISKG